MNDVTTGKKWPVTRTSMAPRMWWWGWQLNRLRWWLGSASRPALRKEEAVRPSMAEERRKPACSPAIADGSSAPRWQRPSVEDGVAAWLLGGDGGGGSEQHGRASTLLNGAQHWPLDYTWCATCLAASDRWPGVEEAVTDRWGRSQTISFRI
jgi:hypothetical protein